MSERQVIMLPAIRCQCCGGVIGILVAINGKTCLQVGALQLVQASGRCVNCRTVYHWVASKKTIKQITARCNSEQSVV